MSLAQRFSFRCLLVLKKKVAWFGGSFDPIHFGHLHLAMEMLERFDLDEVRFSPAYTSPFKEGKAVVSAYHRLEMVRLALEGVPRCRVWDWEAKQEGVSYTIDAIRALREEYLGGVELFLIVGDDHIAGFERWKDARYLATECHLLIGSRRMSPASVALPDDSVIKEAIVAGTVEMPLFEVSATDIRKRLMKKHYCGHLVPGKVLDYIVQNRLY